VDGSILLVSSGVRHPSPLARFRLRGVLRAGSAHQLKQVRSLEVLSGLSLELFGAVALYLHHETVSPSALRELDDFVARGGGLLAIHAASASYRDEAQWLRMLSGRFREHGPVDTFRVEPSLDEDEIFGGVSSFSIRDELYRHDYDPNVRVHFSTVVNGDREPVVWTKYWGVGRVCYCSLGHSASSVHHPQVQEILRRGLAWVCAQ
jgi:type 1 glutamine amidotransferase